MVDKQITLLETIDVNVYSFKERLEILEHAWNSGSALRRTSSAQSQPNHFPEDFKPCLKDVNQTHSMATNVASLAHESIQSSQVDASSSCDNETPQWVLNVMQQMNELSVELTKISQETGLLNERVTNFMQKTQERVQALEVQILSLQEKSWI